MNRALGSSLSLQTIESLHDNNTLYLPRDGALIEPVILFDLKHFPYSQPFFKEAMNKFVSFDMPFIHIPLFEYLDYFSAQEVSDPVFIFHVSRCGSTLISSVIDQLSTTIVIKEFPFDFKMSSYFYVALKNFLHQFAKQKQPIIFKMTPTHNLYIDYILQKFPKAKMLFLYRNGLDVIASCLNEPLAITQSIDLLNQTSEGLSWHKQDYYTGNWLFSMNIFKKYLEFNDSDNIVSLAYEDFIEQPLLVTQRIFDFFQIEKKITDDELKNVMKVDAKKKSEFSYSSKRKILNEDLLHQYIKNFSHEIDFSMRLPKPLV